MQGQLFPIEESYVIQEMEFFIYPALPLATPPGILVVKGYTNPSVQ